MSNIALRIKLNVILQSQLYFITSCKPLRSMSFLDVEEHLHQNISLEQLLQLTSRPVCRFCFVYTTLTFTAICEFAGAGSVPNTHHRNSSCTFLCRQKELRLFPVRVCVNFNFAVHFLK